MSQLNRDLDDLIAAVALAGPVERGLIGGCHRCRNRMVYLLYPPSPHLHHDIGARLRALPLDHERHGEPHHPDDKEPKLP